MGNIVLEKIKEGILDTENDVEASAEKKNFLELCYALGERPL